MGNQQAKEVQYSIEFETNKQGETPIYRNPSTPLGPKQIPRDGPQTLQAQYLLSLKYNADRECLATRRGSNKKYQSKTYAQVGDIAKKIGSGIINLNLISKTREYEGIKLNLIGIYAQNREEWAMLDFANILYGFTMVPLYDSLGPDTIQYVLNHSEIETCLCQKSTVQNLMKCSNTGQLKNIIMVDELTGEEKQQIQQKGIQIIQWEALIKAGEQKIHPFPSIPQNSTYTFSYTSGTTGDPKAAMLSHKNMLSLLIQMEGQEPKLSKQDVHLSYLPLPHVFERAILVVLLSLGAKICFFNGDILKLKEDLAEVQPTLFASVPRLYNKFYSAINQKFSDAKGLAGFLVSSGLGSKMNNLEDGSTTHKLWDTLVFNKTKAILGGKCKVMISGSAPISKDVVNFMKVAMCCPFKEGYGMTETCATGLMTNVDDTTTGHVGGPTQIVEIKLVDVPEMNYTSKDKDNNGSLQPRGEICLRGPGIFQGYYKNKEKTDEMIDKEEWLHTGDIGMRLPSGAFKIVDRKKNIFKLAQGEYVAPEKVENIYVRLPEVEQVFLHGDSLQSYCVGIIHPNEQIFTNLATQKGQSGSFESLCENEVMKKAMLEIVNQEGKKEKLFGFEQAKTNTMKLQRHNAKEVFKAEIQKVYAQHQQ